MSQTQAPQGKLLAQWGTSLLLALGLHTLLILAALFWPIPVAPPPLPMAAMVLELAPMPEMPSQPEVPPGPQQEMSTPTPPPPVEPKPLPKLAEAPKPKISVPPKREEPKPVPKPPEPQEIPAEEVPDEPKPPAPSTSAPTSSQTPTENSAAPVTGATARNQQAQETWQSKLLSHLSRYKRYPEDARRRNQEGVNRLRFTVDKDGKVLAYSIVARSGSASLDRATMEMIRRAQPLPPPPPELLNGDSLEVTAPFIYSLEKERRRR